MKVILVDDEKAGLENLHYYLSKYGNIELLGMYQDPLEALQGIIELKPDAVFLDIMMPEMSGLEAASEILKFEEGIKIVFVTAFDDHAIKAFELNAIDYVLEPYSDQRIEMAVNRINRLMHENDPVKYEKKNHAIQFEAMKSEIIKIPVWKDERIFLCDPFEISYLSSEDGNVKKGPFWLEVDPFSQSSEIMNRCNPPSLECPPYPASVDTLSINLTPSTPTVGSASNNYKPQNGVTIEVKQGLYPHSI